MQDLTAALNLATDSQIILKPLTGGALRKLPVRTVELVAGLALIRVLVSWEAFLEESFVRYMAGDVTSSGFSPKLNQPIEKSLNAARKNLLGKRLYLSWARADTDKRARMFFENGDPYATAISAISTALDDAAGVRNRFVHRSDFSQQGFRKIVVSALGYMPKGMTPGRFLISSRPPFIKAQPSQTYLEYFAGQILAAAKVVIR